MKAIRFFELEKEYKKAKKELSSDKATKIIEKYNKELKLMNSLISLSENYSPTFAILKYYYKNFQNKNLLEIGFSTPNFLEFLKLYGFNVNGIDIEPYVTSDDYLKMSVEDIDKNFLKLNNSKFDAITSKISLSKLYNENFELKTGKPAFKNPNKILKNLKELMNNNGLLILQEDRGSIFTEKMFKENGFQCLVKPYPIILKNNKKEYSGWNVISAYVLSK
jgi:hypothetical protein